MGHPYWPIFDVEIRTPTLTLRAVDDELAVALAHLAGRGVHDPAFAPFLIPWTDLPSPDLERGVLQFHWRTRSETSALAWRLPFAAVVDGEVSGAIDLAATEFPSLREFETGSWLGREHQGRGLGKELRIAALTFGFDALDAEFATTGAWHDNEASLGVTRSLGYEHVGTRRALRRDQPDALEGYRMSREHFASSVRRDDIELVGDAAVRELLGIARAT
jgi:RimJ/RimL family protein N-acetyltransferase